MAPKKASAAAAAKDNKDAGNAGDGKFSWTPELERKLLMLTLGRTLSNEDYEQILTVFPGTNLNGVKIRTSRLRCERADIFAKFGWELPEGGKAGARRGPKAVSEEDGKAPPKAVRKGRKRGAEEDTDAAEKSVDTKASTAKKAKNSPVVKDEDEGEEFA